MAPEKVPLLGVAGAFVFAAQMINFPVAGGTSGHLLGAALVAILLGPWAAVLVMTAVLVIQCFVFQDGGALALGANILNMGVTGGLLGYVTYAGIGNISQRVSVRYTAAFLAGGDGWGIPLFLGANHFRNCSSPSSIASYARRACSDWNRRRAYHGRGLSSGAPKPAGHLASITASEGSAIEESDDMRTNKANSSIGTEKSIPRPPLDCEPLFDILSGYEKYRLLTSAVQLGVFSHLREATEAQALGDRLGTNATLTEKYLNCLVAIGLVLKEGKTYVNSPLSSTYLAPDSPFSLPNLIQLIQNGETFWDRIPTALKGHQEAEKGPGHLEAVFDRSFVVAMAEGAMRGGLQVTVDVLSRRPEFRQAKKLLDLGGGHGLYATGFALANPSMEVTIFDLPPVIQVAREYVEQYGVGDRVKLISGDFLKDKIGDGYDVVFASDALYRPRDVLQPVLDKVRDSLLDGGLFVTKHWAMNPDRTGPLTTVLWDFRLALGAYGHYVYDNDEYVTMLKQVGFDCFEVIDISTKAKPSTLVLAKKPSGGER